MPVGLKHVHFELSFALSPDLHLEELSPFVGDNIERVAAKETVQLLHACGIVRR